MTFKKTAEMHIAAYNAGLIGQSHPLRETISEAVCAQDSLDGLIEYEDLLTSQRDDEGFYIRDEETMERVGALIAHAIEKRDEAFSALIAEVEKEAQ